MLSLPLLILGLLPLGCGDAALECVSWYHNCNCAYVCEDASVYDAYLDEEQTCDVACDDGSFETAPTQTCASVGGRCDWVD